MKDMLTKVYAQIRAAEGFLGSLPHLPFDPYRGVRFFYHLVFGAFALFGFIAWDCGIPITSSYISSHEDEVVRIVVLIGAIYLLLFLLKRVMTDKPGYPRDFRPVIVGFYGSGFFGSLSIFLRFLGGTALDTAFEGLFQNGSILLSYSLGYVASMAAMFVYKYAWLICVAHIEKSRQKSDEAKQG